MKSYIVVIYVVRCLVRAGRSIIKEQVTVVVAESEDDFCRLFIDIAARSQTDRVTFIEVKSLELSAVHAYTELVGQESGAGPYRSNALLPDRHIALMTPEQLLEDLGSRQGAQRARGHPAFRQSSKATDIGHQRVERATASRKLLVFGPSSPNSANVSG